MWMDPKKNVENIQIPGYGAGSYDRIHDRINCEKEADKENLLADFMNLVMHPCSCKYQRQEEKTPVHMGVTDFPKAQGFLF